MKTSKTFDSYNLTGNINYFESLLYSFHSVYWYFRYVSQGKGILQPHQLLAEFEAVIPEEEKQKLKDSVFGDVLRATQVMHLTPSELFI